ncbi:RNA polymerase factor sigma-54 [Brucella haematophila]|uniref:RNA polymerase factor sigma-54 n=1 Tax=Brucella haematophila TaxID=419474 RepID=UPI00110D3B35|nr:RNA polymerase factor sigma-54 [Brucella haematophila]KAB2701041.1 RNA polymerase factor sigma-54 [Ochrobactrum sp. Kaboul]TMV05036.1 RNA polymerase factor sigma-54 [Brucella haematophila]
MALSPKLDFRQSQSLVMTPQLMQSIKLLQMTHLELEHFLDLEIEKNPLLDRIEAANDDFAGVDAARDDDRSSASGDPTDDRQSDEDGPFDEGQVDWFKTDAPDAAENLSTTFDSSLENIFPDDPGRYDEINPDLAAQWKSSTLDAYSSGSGGGYDLDQVTASRVSLADFVGEQIALTFSQTSDRFIAMALADALDESGYLRVDIIGLAQNLGVETVEVERVLAVMQSFDPPGIFARDLRECLAIQLRLKDRFDPAMAALVENLDLLARRDFATLKKLCGVDQADILDMLSEIRTLDPKPGALFEVAVADAIVPDAVVTPSRDGGWAIELNPAAMPRLIVNNEYYAEVSASVKAEEKTFLADCMQTASWLVRSLDQRARTILKVTQEIVRQQDGFLRHGVTHLKPLNLRMVADAVGMHESTISRVTANKFMETPRGVFELRYFFTASIASSEGGDAHSSESVRHRIRQMIDAEKPDDVLSDDAIVDALKKDGVDIARRTVAKYRESMNIASSVQRRREKKAKLSVS